MVKERNIVDPLIVTGLDSILPKEITDIVLYLYLGHAKNVSRSLMFVIEQKQLMISTKLRHSRNLTIHNTVMFYIVSKNSGVKITRLLKNPVPLEIVLELADQLIAETEYDSDWHKYWAARIARPLRVFGYKVVSEKPVDANKEEMYVKDGASFIVGE